MAEKKKTVQKMEREYVIPLREKCRPVPRYKKTNRAVKTVKEFLVRHMKLRDRDLKKVKLDSYLNEYLWARGIKNPPHKVKVKAVKEGDIVNVSLIEMPKKILAHKKRHDKRESKAQEAAEKKKTMMQKMKEGTAPNTDKEEIKPSEENKEKPSKQEVNEEEKKKKDSKAEPGEKAAK